MYFVYVLRSLKDGRLYIGMTEDVPSRLKRHSEGKVTSTRHRRPLVLVYTESYNSRAEARRREKFLKSGPGHAFLRSIGIA
jgi:putative endonuclease